MPNLLIIDDNPAVATALLFWRLGVVLDGGRFASGEIIGMLGLGAAAAGFAGAGVWFAQWAPAEAERAMRRLVVSRVFDLPRTWAALKQVPVSARETAALLSESQYAGTRSSRLLLKGAARTPASYREWL